MKTNLFHFLFFLLLTISNSAFAQKCGTDEFRKKLIQEHPEILQREEELEKYTSEYVLSHWNDVYGTSRTDTSTHFIIPVVFHILHFGGSENIADTKVYNEIDNLNLYYSATNADLSQVIAQHQPLIGDMKIEFRLATKDPNGNCTNGIEHIYTYQAKSANEYAKVSNWPREKYLNVWSFIDIPEGPNQTGIILGYANYPSSVITQENNNFARPGYVKDGYLILASQIGIGGTTTPHEIGHWLNLPHPWGNGQVGTTCGDDGVDDTPITKGGFGCPINNLSSVTDMCMFPTVNPGNPPGTIANFQNIMDYYDCAMMFTKGQTLRARAALTDTIAQRNNLITAANHAVTGVDVLSRPDCPPIAEFGVGLNSHFVCAGTNVTFSDYSYNADPAGRTRTWTFPSDASVTTSSTATQAVSFTDPGWKEVTLVSQSSVGTGTKTKSIVYVADPAETYSTPYFEHFEDPASIGTRWIPINIDNNHTAFSRTTTTGLNSGACAMVNGYNCISDKDPDFLISPEFDLSTLSTTNNTISFFYSAAKGDASALNDSIEELKVFVSANCGLSWNPLISGSAPIKKGVQLFSAGAQSAPYVANRTEDGWKKVTLTINNAYLLANSRFKFEFYGSHNGNHFYLDNINIGGIQAGIEEAHIAEDFTIYPNPSNGKSTLEVTLTKETEATIKAYDMIGNEVAEIFKGKLAEGGNVIDFGEQLTAKGVYAIQMQVGKQSIQRKFVKF